MIISRLTFQHDHVGRDQAGHHAKSHHSEAAHGAACCPGGDLGTGRLHVLTGVCPRPRDRVLQSLLQPQKSFPGVSPTVHVSVIFLWKTPTQVSFESWEGKLVTPGWLPHGAETDPSLGSLAGGDGIVHGSHGLGGTEVARIARGATNWTSWGE